ncbi:MAG: chromate transporter [Clostridia bacterium]|nr:chromate transporter [Clostridia bacterium]
MKEKVKLLAKLFFTMMKIGLFTFGGGYAMLALLENEFVSKKGWIEKDEFADMVAIAESTPGPIAINASTYIGYKVAGFFGSLCATIAVCIPSFIIIYIISIFFDAFLSLTYVAYAFKGIQVCVVYMILSAGIKMLKNLKKKPLDIILLVVTVVVMVAFSVFAVNFSAVFYILIGGAVGLFVYFIGVIRSKNREKKQ